MKRWPITSVMLNKSAVSTVDSCWRHTARCRIRLTCFQIPTHRPQCRPSFQTVQPFHLHAARPCSSTFLVGLKPFCRRVDKFEVQVNLRGSRSEDELSIWHADISSCMRITPLYFSTDLVYSFPRIQLTSFLRLPTCRKVGL